MMSIDDCYGDDDHEESEVTILGMILLKVMMIFAPGVTGKQHMGLPMQSFARVTTGVAIHLFRLAQLLKGGYRKIFLFFHRSRWT